jgi:uncharacterized protein
VSVGVRDNRAVADVFRPGGITYLRIPALDGRAAALFYAAVFGWEVSLDRANPSFRDAGGHVIGHFVADQPVAGEGGVRPYVYVESVDDALRRALEGGGEIAAEPYPEGDLRVATLRDPEGNVVGVWQRAAG